MNINISIDELVDIHDVNVDTNLPKQERIVEFIRQIKNPYLFKCGEFIVHAEYAKNGVSFEDCLERIVE